MLTEETPGDQLKLQQEWIPAGMFLEIFKIIILYTKWVYLRIYLGLLILTDPYPSLRSGTAHPANDKATSEAQTLEDM